MVKTLSFKKRWLVLPLLALLFIAFTFSDKVRIGLIRLLPAGESTVISYELPGKPSGGLWEKSGFPPAVTPMPGRSPEAEPCTRISTGQMKFPR